jgi:hypothetical protein
MGKVMDPAQAAWVEYIATHYLDRFTIEAAHRAFMAGWAAAKDDEEGRQT